MANAKGGDAKCTRYSSKSERAAYSEEEIRVNLIRGYKDVQDGNVSSAVEFLAELRANRGW